ncbi:hypothetical protein [Flavihumibacter profundi]|jgi:hypothetical protein|uniref:hypothetical protein n=1 Tax=Flavihumibacter profundi TaxID=2716883 RepID=UPI001CC6F92C|nr:hypothetical protein [Flavihumibacter profundi]MBZ5855817.1 hypothetical protein [Flavihumibacter profundi]
MELNKTIQFYFRQPSLDSVSIPELEKAVEKFPYCASLQYLLLKKQFQENDPGFGKQLDKAYLYFPNYYRLHTLLKEPAASKHFDIPPVPEIITPAEQPVPETPELLVPEIQAEEDESPAQEVESGPEPALRTDLLMKESPIPIPSLKDISPQTDELPIFEPYHTIDYFASQGIKLSHELPVNDKLGRQLRSFTDWIKTMKRLPQTDLEQQIAEAGLGEKIVAMAAGSVQHSEILTETMAEVLVKQGNFGKAIDLYHKLSLAHPDKSVYFAARIEQLKHR